MGFTSLSARRNLTLIRDDAPIFYRGLVVGRVVAKAIDAEGQPFLSAVVQKEYAGSLTKNARFGRCHPPASRRDRG